MRIQIGMFVLCLTGLIGCKGKSYRISDEAKNAIGTDAYKVLTLQDSSAGTVACSTWTEIRMNEPRNDLWKAIDGSETILATYQISAQRGKTWYVRIDINASRGATDIGTLIQNDSTAQSPLFLNQNEASGKLVDFDTTLQGAGQGPLYAIQIQMLASTIHPDLIVQKMLLIQGKGLQELSGWHRTPGTQRWRRFKYVRV